MTVSAPNRSAARPAEDLHEFRDLLALIGFIARRNGVVYAMRDMILQHFGLDARERSAHGRELRHQLNAIAILVDHLREAVYIPQ